MINRLLAIDLKNQQDFVFVGFSIIAMLSILVSVISYSIIPATIPIALIGLYILIMDVRLVYFGLIALLAVSTEVELPGGFGTDLPGEPLMILITGIYFLLVFTNAKSLWIPIKEPVTFLLIFHVLWIAVTAITAEDVLVSFKFLLAKIWYVIPFYFTAFVFLKGKKTITMMLRILLGMVMIAALYVMVKHMALGFRFDTIEQAVQPVFRNHVNYACLLVVTLPYLWMLTWWANNQKKNLQFWILIAINGFILLAIYFSFTRAAILSVVLGIGAYVVLRLKLTRLAFIASIIGAILSAAFMINSNRFMDYAPNFERTISHTEFDNLLEATAKGEDISTMERVYRWIAGIRMIEERPLVGYGSGNFYPYYKHKAISSFETYVSNNPEKSGIHCYYLMVPVEQGIPGLIIFLLLCFYILYEAERSYHKLKDAFYRTLISAAYISVVIILSILIVNDLLEADKVGPFFFLGAALIVLGKRLGLDPEKNSLK